MSHVLHIISGPGGACIPGRITCPDVLTEEQAEAVRYAKARVGELEVADAKVPGSGMIEFRSIRGGGVR